MRPRGIGLVLAVFMSLVLALPATAHAPSGAIFTTLVDGSEVNYNIYDAKEDVYLDGGPGPGAPQHAAGLDDGTYVFQVTDPSGKVLLSEDAAECRLFEVSGGIITSVAPAADSCTHATGFDIDHNALTVQLMPYLNTPNPGGVYKVWVTPIEDYKCNLNIVDCGLRRGKNGHVHGFVPRHSKTDNFKVRQRGIVEIDTRFFSDRDGDGHRGDGEEWLLGRAVTWTDTHGATNIKYSYYDPALDVNWEAHVEAPEVGVHHITIANQVGCLVGLVHLEDGEYVAGPQTVSVEIFTTDVDRTVFIDVACTVS